jgi:hypothetical protein
LPFVSRSPSTSHLNAVIEAKRPDRLRGIGRDLIVARSSAAAGAVAAFKSYFIMLVLSGSPGAEMSYRQILVTAGPVRRRRLWADGQRV